MSSSALDSTLPPADEPTVRAHASELQALAEQMRITKLRFASAGRLVGHVDAEMDAFDVIDFDIAATDLLGAAVELFSDAVLGKPNVSPDLVTARPL